MTVADSHCHAWEVWPYSVDVPDPSTRGSIDQLMSELDAHHVERALVVCASIGPGDETPRDNNEYVARAAAEHPNRISYVVDIDSEWSPHHHQAGAVDRVEAMLAAHPHAVGISHYLGADDDGWLRTDEAVGFFSSLSTRSLVASVSCPPSRLRDLTELAVALPDVTFLIHHMGWLRAESSTLQTDLEALLAASSFSNVYVKISGFHYASRENWNFPYLDTGPILRAIVSTFDPTRLLWGSDFPASQGKVTYRQALAAPATLLPGLTDLQLDGLMGDNLVALLDRAAPIPRTADLSTAPPQNGTTRNAGNHADG
ncbi:MAG TPA: amidohydrolase family protein [Pseudolysinimonas sp.]|nr:amidohydrolase family protein [Pseudolysinimonas sp.]